MNRVARAFSSRAAQRGVLGGVLLLLAWEGSVRAFALPPYILPGVIDTQVHFREPGLTHKEDLESGSRSAVLGGVAAVFEMPNTKPATTNAQALADKVASAAGRMFCDFAFFVGATRDNVDELPELELLPGAAGIKVFMGSSTGDLLVDDEETLARILAKTRRRASFHAEDEARLKSRTSHQREGDSSSHSDWRDAEAALTATERLVRLASAAGLRPSEDRLAPGSPKVLCRWRALRLILCRRRMPGGATSRRAEGACDGRITPGSRRGAGRGCGRCARHRPRRSHPQLESCRRADPGLPGERDRRASVLRDSRR